MKNKLIQLLLISPCIAGAQLISFESLPLAASSAYVDSNSTPFTVGNAAFTHRWSKQYGLWTGGFSYTNKFDTANGTFGNLYGVIAGKGANGSDKWNVGQEGAVIRFSTPVTVSGFSITNTTYVYKTIRDGSQFSKKFGGASGNDPDFFKLVAVGFRGGQQVQDSAEFFLADFRGPSNADYIVKSWTPFNTAVLGAVDSIRFVFRSSDVGSFGINTPLFFAMDDLLLTSPATGIADEWPGSATVYPNPVSSLLHVRWGGRFQYEIFAGDRRIGSGESSDQVDVSTLNPGLYTIIASDASHARHYRFVKL